MLERITRREEADLFVAWIAISISFAIIFISPGGFLNFNSGHVSAFTALVYFGVSLVVVFFGFILHEMAHKFTAIKYGFWAEFRKDNMMLLVAVALAALVGVVFAAPGATMIYNMRADGRMISREENGKISGGRADYKPDPLYTVCRAAPLWRYILRFRGKSLYPCRHRRASGQRDDRCLQYAARQRA